MAFWSAWFRREQKYSTQDLVRDLGGGAPTRSGIPITWSTALEVATVLACIRVIAEGISQVPWKLYDRDSKPASEHPLYRLIYRKPNRWQTSFEFRETIAFHAALMGNAYVFVGRVGSKREVRELVPLEPQFMKVEKRDGVLIYKYSPTIGESKEFDASVIWHIKGPSWNGWVGMDAVKLVREAVSLAIAAESAHAEMHKSGSRIGGLYTVEGSLTKEQYDYLAGWLDKYVMGGERAGKPLILDRGAKFAAQQMTGVDAQHLETRKHQIEEICREYRVMPIMIGYSDKAATYASAEQMFIAHVVHCLQPWYERLEQSADTVLLTEDEQRQGFYTKFTPNALMRGAAKDRAEFYQRAIGSVNASPGWMTANEIRALEELAPDGDPESDKVFRPQPNTAADQAATQAGKQAQVFETMGESFRAMAEAQKMEASKPPVEVTINNEQPRVDVSAPVVNVTTPDVKVEPTINVEPAKVQITQPEIKVNVTAPEAKPRRTRTKVVEHDSKGRIKEFVQEDMTDVD